MRTIVLLCLLVVGVFLLDLSVWAWGNDVLVFDGPVTCFDADYSPDGTMYVVFQRAHPDWPICYASSSDHGRTWEYHGSAINVGHRLEKIRALVGEYQDWPALYVFYIRSGTPSMTRVVVGDAPTVESVAIATLASHAYDFDVAMASEHVSALEGGAGPHEPADALPILFAFREAGGDTIHLHRSQNGGMTWREVHTIDDVSTYGGSAGLALAWGPPSTFFYVWKKYKPERSGCDDPPEGDPCYTAYWGWNKLNGNPFSLWAEGWVLEPAGYNEYGYWSWAHSPVDYYHPQLAMSFNPYQPVIWAVFQELVYNGTVGYFYTEETGWEFHGWGEAIPDRYVSDIEPYRVIGNPYSNYVDVVENSDGDVPNNCICWSWSSAAQPSQREGEPGSWCINDHDTNIVTPGFGPQLIYSPGSEIGGAGIVYLGFTMDGGPPEPALYFDAPWFHRVIRRDSPAEPWSSFMTLDSEPSEHPMMYVPEPGSRDIWFNVAETAVCRGTTSHELDVSWSATGLGASISVSIQIADSLKVLAIFETDQPEGTHRFLLDRPAGGPITVTVRATDSAGATMKAKSITLSPC